MVHINIFDKEVADDNGNLYPIFNMDIFNRINVVIGDSGAGKSHFFRSLQLALLGSDPWTYSCVSDQGEKLNIHAITSIDDYKLHISDVNSIIVIDEDVTEALRKNGNLDLMNKSRNYFILLDRQLQVKVETNIASILGMKSFSYKGNKIYKAYTYFNMQGVSDVDYNKYQIEFIVTEDKKSGKTFWKEELDKLNLVDLDHDGSGGLQEKIEEILSKSDKDILVALDYDRGSKILFNILESKDIDKSRIHFIALESFEEVICNSEFILSVYPQLRDLVINYKRYITCSSPSTGSYFSALLFKYVKQRPPISVHSKRNIEQFYSKGMTNFKECFIDDCCSFNNAECKLRFSGNKRKAMLANKFKGYRVFQSGGTDKE